MLRLILLLFNLKWSLSHIVNYKILSNRLVKVDFQTFRECGKKVKFINAESLGGRLSLICSLPEISRLYELSKINVDTFLLQEVKFKINEIEVIQDHALEIDFVLSVALTVEFAITVFSFEKGSDTKFGYFHPNGIMKPSLNQKTVIKYEFGKWHKEEAVITGFLNGSFDVYKTCILERNSIGVRKSFSVNDRVVRLEYSEIYANSTLTVFTDFDDVEVNVSAEANKALSITYRLPSNISGPGFFKFFVGRTLECKYGDKNGKILSTITYPTFYIHNPFKQFRLLFSMNYSNSDECNHLDFINDISNLGILCFNTQQKKLYIWHNVTNRFRENFSQVNIDFENETNSIPACVNDQRNINGYIFCVWNQHFFSIKLDKNEISTNQIVFPFLINNSVIAISPQDENQTFSIYIIGDTKGEKCEHLLEYNVNCSQIDANETGVLIRMVLVDSCHTDLSCDVFVNLIQLPTMCIQLYALSRGLYCRTQSFSMQKFKYDKNTNSFALINMGRESKYKYYSGFFDDDDDDDKVDSMLLSLKFNEISSFILSNLGTLSLGPDFMQNISVAIPCEKNSVYTLAIFDVDGNGFDDVICKCEEMPFYYIAYNKLDS